VRGLILQRRASSIWFRQVAIILVSPRLRSRPHKDKGVRRKHYQGPQTRPSRLTGLALRTRLRRVCPFTGSRSDSETQRNLDFRCI
jgi:hypothetical protein